MLRRYSAGMDRWWRSTPEESKYGAMETRKSPGGAEICFEKNRDRIDGVIVTLPNFGEERAIADTLRYSTSKCQF